MNSIVHVDVVGDWGTGKTTFIAKLGDVDINEYTPTTTPSSMMVHLHTTIGDVRFMLTEFGGRRDYDRTRSSDALFVFVDNVASIKTIRKYVRNDRKNVVVCLNKCDDIKRERLYNNADMFAFAWPHNATMVRTSSHIQNTLHEPFNAILRTLYGEGCCVIND
uniref:Uncharacterized protein n=1 Tax=viral metagenome TaxID=1070528 RepID=A0A6C0M072_9ZZZZ